MPFLFFRLKVNGLMAKKYMGLITFHHLKSAGRPERMGRNTFKSMRGVLCVGRR